MKINRLTPVLGNPARVRNHSVLKQKNDLTLNFVSFLIFLGRQSTLTQACNNEQREYNHDSVKVGLSR